MEKNYIRMNNNKKYLSLGNLFSIIKEISKGSSAMQREIFCALFDVNDINPTTVNNYCIGIRAIGLEYKKIYFDFKEDYLKNNLICEKIILNLISILNEHIYIKNEQSLKEINSNYKLKELCLRLLEIADNDVMIDNFFVTDLNNLLLSDDLYNTIVKLLFYIVLENKQPLYNQKMDMIIRKKELEEYLKIKLYDGVSYITSLIYLSKKNNVYACAEMGSLEFDGLVDNHHNYEKSFEYYLIAAKKGHPKACWMVANMILTKKVKKDFDTLWMYLNKAVKLGSVAALNTMGKCYLEKSNPQGKPNLKKAESYFIKASYLGYPYAYNNLGLLYEKKGDFAKALNYYKISADMKESWALNKVGEYYRKKGDLATAYIYYKLSNACPISERCKWPNYNLEKYYSKNKH